MPQNRRRSSVLSVRAGIAAHLVCCIAAGVARADATLSGYWKFDGGLASDASDYSNHGQVFGLSGSVGFDDVPNGAFLFDSQGDQFLVPDAPSLRTPTALSVSMWVRSPGDPDRVFISKYNSSAGRNDWTFATYNFEGDELNPRVYEFGEGSEFGMQRRTTSADVPPNAWTHIGFSYSSVGPSLRIFKNAVEQPGVTFGTSVAAIHLSSEPLRIGANINRFGDLNSFVGAIDEVRVYKGSLSSAQFASLGRAGQSLEWVADEDGFWDSPGNWNYRVPDGVGIGATFGDTISVARRVTLQTSRTIGAATFEATNPYTLDGGATLVLQRTPEPAYITIRSGSHAIATPLHLASSATVTVLNNSDTLTVSGEMTGAVGVSLTKAGAGVLAVKHLRVDGVSIDGERITVLPGVSNNEPARVSRVKSLSLAGAAAPSVILDLHNNSLVVDYDGPSPRALLEAQITAGQSAGRGIISGTQNVAAGIAALGIADASETGIGNLFGQEIDSTTTLIRYTRVGDANLSGQTNIADFALLAAHFNAPGRWFTGDFNFSGVNDISDFALLAANFNQSLPAPGTSIQIPETRLSAPLAMTLTTSLLRLTSRSNGRRHSRPTIS